MVNGSLGNASLSETKQKILNTDGYLKNQSPGLRRNLDHHEDICPRRQNVGRTNYHVIGRKNLLTLNLRQRERLKPRVITIRKKMSFNMF